LVEKHEVLVEGNYNRGGAYDRTKWYAFKDEEAWFLERESILQKRKMEVAKMKNPNCKSETPIPNPNTDIRTDINQLGNSPRKAEDLELVLAQDKAIAERKRMFIDSLKRILGTVSQRELRTFTKIANYLVECCQNGKYDIDIVENVRLNRDLFRLNLNGAAVTIRLDPMKNRKLNFQCSACTTACEHLGAAFSLILEEKLSLGLAAPPPERVPIESLTDEELVKQAIEERAERARTERMRVNSADGNELWTDYTVMNYSSGKTYRVALRGRKRGESYCSCPDFRKNTLGTCKHILHVLGKVKKRFNKTVRNTPFQVSDVYVYLRYGEELKLRILLSSIHIRF